MHQMKKGIFAYLFEVGLVFALIAKKECKQRSMQSIICNGILQSFQVGIFFHVMILQCRSRGIFSY